MCGDIREIFYVFESTLSSVLTQARSPCKTICTEHSWRGYLIWLHRYFSMVSITSWNNIIEHMISYIRTDEIVRLNDKR